MTATPRDHYFGDVPIPATCSAFGHALGAYRWSNDIPPCRQCAALIKRMVAVTRDRYGTWEVRDHCGKIGQYVRLSGRAATDPDNGGPYYAYTAPEPDGPVYAIGRRWTRLEAVAAILASHDCVD
jgi:hypothetical protein